MSILLSNVFYFLYCNVMSVVLSVVFYFCIECCVFGKVSREGFSESFGRAILNCRTETLRFNDKHPGRKRMTVFEFFQRPKVLVPKTF